MLKFKYTCFLVILLLFGAYSIESQAQNDSTDIRKGFLKEKPWPVSKFTAKIGGFWAANTTELGAGLNGKDYSVFNFEKDLDMNRNTFSALIDLDARFGKHNRVNLSYYNIYRSKSTTLDKEIHFGEHDYPIDSEIKAHMNTHILRLSYGYSFISTPKLELGALVGFHIMAFDIGFDMNGKNQDLSFQDDVKFTAPLPDFGIFGTYAFNNRWAVSAELSYFYIKYNSLTGRILNASIYGQYKLNKHWEADLGYSTFDVRVDLDRKYLDADFKWGYGGPFVSLAYKFGN